MDAKGEDAGMNGLHRDGDARRDPEDGDRGETANNEENEKHTAHSTSQPGSGAILEEVHELSDFAERAFQGGSKGQEPIATSPSNDNANEALQAYQVPDCVEEPDEDLGWGIPSFSSWGKRKKSKKSSIEEIETPPRIAKEEAEAARIAVEKGGHEERVEEKVAPSSEVEVGNTLGPEDSRSISSGTARPTRRRRRPRRNTRSLSGDRDVLRTPRPHPTENTMHDTIRAGYALTPYFGLPNYWPYGPPPPPNPGQLRDPGDPASYSIQQENNFARNEVNSLPEKPHPLNKDGSAQNPKSGRGWSLNSPVPATASSRCDPPAQQHTAILGFTAAHRYKLSEPLVDGLPQPPGYERPSIQSDGLAFSVSVQCSHATLHSRFSTLLHQYWPELTAHNDLGSVWVRKAVSSKRFKQRDGLHSVELVCHTGPTPTDSDNYQIQWLHMQRHQMDLDDFEDMCLNAPNITGELRYVVLRLFKKIRDTARKRFRDSYYITPGTVLRCDGATSRSAADYNLSVTFICFPYLALEAPSDHDRQTSDYPTRSMLQILYPYETTSVNETPPSFCKDANHASDRLMYVPQLWTVIIGSKYVITCANLGSNEVLGTSVTVAQSMTSTEHIPALADDWMPDKYANIRVEEFLDEEYSDSGGSVRLFDGKRIEEFLVDDDEWSIKETIPSPAVGVIDHDLPILNETRAQSHPILRYKSHTVDNDGREEYVSFVASMVNEDTNNPTFRDEKAEETQGSADQHNSSHVVSKMDEEKDSLLSMLRSLQNPRLDAGYLESYGTLVSYVLHVWGKSAGKGKLEHMKALTGMEQSLHSAEILRRLCVTKAVSDPTLPMEGFMVEGGNLDQSVVDKELQILGEAVQYAMTLLQDAPNIALDPIENVSIATPEETATQQAHADFFNAPKSTLVRRSTPPFLTWAWLSSGFEQSIPASRMAAENLFTIMQDIDRHLCRSKEDSYTNASKTTLADLEQQMSLQRTSSELSASYVFLPNIPSSPRTLAAPPSPLNHALESEVTDDVILQSQKHAIVRVVNEIGTTAQNFVGLFIPCSYQHSVSQKIWGSLSDLLQDAASIVNDRTERAHSNFLIRPLEKLFMKEHKIEDPLQPLRNCVSCREGHVYRTAQEASAHLRRAHFGGRDNLLLIAHMHRAHRYWVRTEDQVRKELFNKHQLRLLQICLNYLKVLYNRADKIHQGILLEDQDDLARYQLPNDLVDCFEATALFIMQSATSLRTTKNEMQLWQHVPGVAFDELQTPAIQAALERLGELGQSAQASMTRAEKTLALSDPETDTMSMGAAGPELLVAVILLNIQKKPILQDVDLDVNQLYQEYTSKLQYQINQFPRKRQLRDIHALQEELSVVQSVNSWQQQSFEKFRRVLDPKSFSDLVPQSRISMFPPEAECLDAGLKTLQSKATELDALEQRTQYLRQQLKQSVEILEADHGKAILVFTMITTIFLPLSFVTSFFGMNTADIRSTDRGQGYFWAIAVPVTAGIVFAAVLIAYHGDKLYDAVLQTTHQFTERRSASPETVSRPERKSSWGGRSAMHRRSWKTRR